MHRAAKCEAKHNDAFDIGVILLADPTISDGCKITLVLTKRYNIQIRYNTITEHSPIYIVSQFLRTVTNLTVNIAVIITCGLRKSR